MLLRTDEWKGFANGGRSTRLFTPCVNVKCRQKIARHSRVSARKEVCQLIFAKTIIYLMYDLQNIVWSIHCPTLNACWNFHIVTDNLGQGHFPYFGQLLGSKADRLVIRFIPESVTLSQFTELRADNAGHNGTKDSTHDWTLNQRSGEEINVVNVGVNLFH